MNNQVTFNITGILLLMTWQQKLSQAKSRHFYNNKVLHRFIWPFNNKSKEASVKKNYSILDKASWTQGQLRFTRTKYNVPALSIWSEKFLWEPQNEEFADTNVLFGKFYFLEISFKKGDVF